MLLDHLSSSLAPDCLRSSVWLRIQVKMLILAGEPLLIETTDLSQHLDVLLHIVNLFLGRSLLDTCHEHVVFFIRRVKVLELLDITIRVSSCFHLVDSLLRSPDVDGFLNVVLQILCFESLPSQVEIGIHDFKTSSHSLLLMSCKPLLDRSPIA